ncbi:hypothetical protein MRB53_000746 [Persea americana]|uniref:Uncharacterized protein n=1 Tax=Persea americana TaxID=3435 RepID=A0ACC2MPZ7_PERAE|nr:hypothetical protein MRB53_000746 [Persea americana]
MSLIFSKPGRALGKETSINLMHDAWEQMHRYILFNCTEVAPFVEEHRKKIYTNNRHKRQIDRERMHNDQFPKWFESHVDCLRLEGDKRVTTDLRLLAGGPSKVASSFSKFVINGFRGVKLDGLGFTLVNLKRLLSTNEPFVPASQALQVFYVQEPVETDWHVAIMTKPRDFFDMHGDSFNANEEETYLESQPYDAQRLKDICIDADNISEVRVDVPGTTIDTPLVTQVTIEDQGDDSEFDDNEFVDSDTILDF